MIQYRVYLQDNKKHATFPDATFLTWTRHAKFAMALERKSPSECQTLIRYKTYWYVLNIKCQHDQYMKIVSILDVSSSRNVKYQELCNEISATYLYLL